MSSITREVTASELDPLVNASRPPEEVPTAALGAEEMDALLSSERAPRGDAPQAASQTAPPKSPPNPPQQAPPNAPPNAPPTPPQKASPNATVPKNTPPSAPQNVIATNTRSAQAATSFTTGERPRVSFPSIPGPGDATVVLAPQLTAAPQAAPSPQPLPGAPQEQGAPPPQAVAAAPYTVETLAAPGPPIPVFTPPPPSRSGLFFVLGGATLLAVAVGAVVFGLRGGSSSAESSPATSPSPASATARASASSRPSTSPPSIGSSTAATGAAASSGPASSASPTGTTGAPEAPPGSREAEARAALARLRDGVATCAREVIGVLPGTSPAVPLAFSMVGRGAYTSKPRDYRSPVFSCVKYKEVAPQRFQIQWQIVKHPGEGRGVAWIDDDGDGKPERAFGFRAALVRKNEVDLGEIGPLEPVPPVMKAPL